MNKHTIFFLFLLAFSCSRNKNDLPEGFVYLKEHIPDIVIDLRYFSSDNFIGDTIDGYESGNCIISYDAAVALTKVQKELNEQGLGLKVFDAYRPQTAVNHFVRWAEDLGDTTMKARYYPEEKKSQLFEKGYIASRSGHTRGSTVDLTIVYLEGNDAGKEMHMGTPWDYFSTRSWPSSDSVTPAQKENRMLLRNVMVKYGFRPLTEEWWHFTLEDEPFPDTYFDFPVK